MDHMIGRGRSNGRQRFRPFTADELQDVGLVVEAQDAVQPRRARNAPGSSRPLAAYITGRRLQWYSGELAQRWGEGRVDATPLGRVQGRHTGCTERWSAAAPLGDELF